MLKMVEATDHGDRVTFYGVEDSIDAIHAERLDLSGHAGGVYLECLVSIRTAEELTWFKGLLDQAWKQHERLKEAKE